MSSQTAPAKSKEVPSSAIPIHKDEGRPARLNQAVSRRAYELYEQSGRENGNDGSHWYQAESELLKALPEIRESASWYTVNCPLVGFSADQIYVGMNSTSAVIVAEKVIPADQPSSGPMEVSQVESVCFRANWPCEVDPATASAYLKNESLTLTVRRAGPVS